VILSGVFGGKIRQKLQKEEHLGRPASLTPGPSPRTVKHVPGEGRKAIPVHFSPLLRMVFYSQERGRG